MAGAAGLRAAAKRTAFGDVSNTTNVVNIVRSTKDDSVVSLKPVDENSEKDIQILQGKKSAALLRPAQRPLSVSGLKGLISSVTSTGNAHNVAPKTIDGNVNTMQLLIPRKALSKVNTAIFKDPVLPSVKEQAIEPSKETRPVASNAPVHQSLVPRLPGPEHAVLAEPNRSDSTILEVHTSDEDVSEQSNNTNVTASVEKSTVARSDGLFIDNNGDIQIYQDAPSPQEEAVVAAAPAESKTKASTRPALLDLPRQDKVDARDRLSDHSISHNGVGQQSEPEEYWDDEEDENYDEEGYVTARSYRSVGGNTTGGATTVLFPLMNQKIKREIAAAKQYVEGSRTAEEIEDDSWDTSMVAEYGDEIFQYMRELEVFSASS
jgi:G2/mitotic-specific cyclin 3/4